MSQPATPVPPEATYADVLAAPQHLVAELVDGELYTHARPRPRHALAESGVMVQVGQSFNRGPRGPGGWWILVEPELHLGKDIVVPEVAGWRCERLPEIPEAAYFELPPDWVCEVLSHSTEGFDRGKKSRVYAREGVPHLWFVNPEARTLAVQRLEGKQWLVLAVHAEEAVAHAEPFPELALDLLALWGGMAPPSEPPGR